MDEAKQRVFLPVGGIMHAHVFEVFLDIEDGRPTQEDIYVERPLIVGWQVECDSSGPFVIPLLSEMAGSSVVCICVPDFGGALRGVRGYLMDGVFADEAAAKAEVLSEAQREWDRRQAAKAARTA